MPDEPTEPPQPPLGGQQPGGYYPPPPSYYQQPQQKRKKWPWILLAVVVLFFGGCVAIIGSIGSSIESASKSNEPSSGSHPSESAPANGIGQEVRDGKFAFTVTNVQRAPTAGTATARGEFVIVTMTVKNTGNQPQSFFSNNQKLFDTAGREYASDSTADSALNSDSGDSMVIDLNPGFDLTAKVAFDVPPGTQVAGITVHDSAFSGGAKISLS